MKIIFSKIILINLMFSVCFDTSNIYSQTIPNPFSTKKHPKPPINLPDVINKTTIMINSLSAFKKAVENSSKMNAKDFGNNVHVVKMEPRNQNPASQIPENQITKPVIKKGEFTNLYWEPVAFFDNQLFPSAIISLAQYKGSSPDTLFEAIRRPLGFRIYSKSTNIPIKWEIECVDKNYFDKVDGTILYTKNPNDKMSLFNADNIPWKYRTLVNTISPTPLNIYFRLFDENGNKVERLATVTVRSINDCVILYNEEDLTDLFSAYVQEDDLPKIDSILKDGTNTKIVDHFLGYQRGSFEVELQVAALWRVLHEKGFVYSSITDNSGTNSNIAYSQTVRTFDNSMKTQQANCVDGTVVFASILRRIGIRAVLVSVPGHCFLGFYDSDKKDAQIQFLETTALSFDNYLSKDSLAADTKYLKRLLPPNYLKTLSAENKKYLRQYFDARERGEGKWITNNKNYPPSQYPGKIKLMDLNDERLKYQPLPFY